MYETWMPEAPPHEPIGFDTVRIKRTTRCCVCDGLMPEGTFGYVCVDPALAGNSDQPVPVEERLACSTVCCGHSEANEEANEEALEFEGRFFTEKQADLHLDELKLEAETANEDLRGFQEALREKGWR